MLKIAAAILIAATPKPTAAPTPTPDQKHAADVWVKDAYAWTDQLTKLGEGLGMTLADVLDDKRRPEALKTQLKEALAQVDEKASAFAARPAPSFAEMTAFKTAFLDYLVWERKVFVTWITDAIRIAGDKKLKRADKEKAVLDPLRAQEKDEDAWKAKIQTAMKAVYAALNRK